MTDAAVVLLRKKMSGKYTLFKVGHDSLVRRFSIIGTSLSVVRDFRVAHYLSERVTSLVLKTIDNRS